MKKLRVCLLIICCIICVSSVSFATNFYDVKGTAYEGIVDRIAGLGIVDGVSKGVFAPNKSITRGQIAKMIVFVRGLQDYADSSTFSPSFSDTKNHWAKDYIETAEDTPFAAVSADDTANLHRCRQHPADTTDAFLSAPLPH